MNRQALKERVKAVLGRVVREHGDEVFISDGYAAHEEIVAGIIELINEVVALRDGKTDEPPTAI